VDVETIKTLGFPAAASVALGYYIWRMTQFLLNDLKNSLGENRDILIKLIDSINNVKVDQTHRICELEQRVAEMREQHRNYNNLLMGNAGGDRVHKSERR
jgi:hypothetical protein